MKMGMCMYVAWLAHPLPGHGNKSGYVTEFKYLTVLSQKENAKLL